MANFKYFADIEGQTFELKTVGHYGKDGFFGFCPELGRKVKVNRVIEFKSNPSKHKCDTRCTQAKGRTMKCECACGGKNHGKG